MARRGLKLFFVLFCKKKNWKCDFNQDFSKEEEDRQHLSFSLSSPPSPSSPIKRGGAPPPRLDGHALVVEPASSGGAGGGASAFFRS